VTHPTWAKYLKLLALEIKKEDELEKNATGNKFFKYNEATILCIKNMQAKHDNYLQKLPAYIKSGAAVQGRLK